ncbi:helix-turn-helix transcriptional regulator [Streptomyces pactum]|uniref:Helix-turn-helix transcriptional regulator n=1 Tax=Streptomyces pactum TaxID=68249 RepID=A0ABS0NDZ9_9ACTN|nr:helix-turn-helix transcriptional regulator [Streptomyces pactum]MBH5333378.1 helix-turn-helix transcriptional regulator [Streptomyces pactum]
MPNAPRTDGPDDATFATVFRQALRRRGLSLERVRDHLRSHGISVSPATLSYWQSGRSQPEKAQSLRAVDALEPLLGLPAGTLRSLLGPRRPRGWAPPHDPVAVRGVYGENSDVERVLGAAFPHFNAGLRRLVVHETVNVNEERFIDETRVTTVVRAVRSGAEHLTVIHSLDFPKAETIDLTVPYGPAPPVRFLPEVDCVAADIPLGRRLAVNETAVVEYTVRYSATGISYQHERRVPTPQKAYLLHVRFHPRALPSNCWHYYRRQLGGEPQRRHRVGLDAFHTTHLLPAKCVPGVYGIEWTWPDRPAPGGPCSGVRSP